MELKPGCIVLSKRGRDQGKLFVVTGVMQPDFVSLADGKIRLLEKPKKKKIKHVAYVDFPEQHRVIDKICSGDKVLNSEIRRLLKEFSEEKDQEV